MMDNPELKFQQVYDEYHAKISRYLSRMIGDDEADDLTQEVFIKIGIALETFRGESQLSTWVYRIATNTALDRIRSANYRPGRKLPMENIVKIEEDKDVWSGQEQASTEQKIIRKEMTGCIREIIDMLPENYRSIIVLSELEGFTDTEIAEIIGLSLSATKIRLHRARAKLKSALNKSCVFYRDENNEFACDRKGPRD